MDNELNTINTLIAERAALLPDEITEIITEGALEIVLYEIQAAFNLSKVQLKLLENEIALTILLFVSPEDLTDRIGSSLEIGRETAEEITSKISNSVFEPLKLVFELAFDSSKTNNSMKRLEQNFKSLREEAMHTSTQENTPAPVAATDTTIPENLPIAETPEATTLTQGTPSITIPYTPTKTSYTVEPMRTMASDVTRVHGYGAYRDLFPDEAGEQTYKEEVIKAAPQEELLQEKPKLAEKPTYGEV